MSLDVYLYSREPVSKKCNHCGSEYKDRDLLFDYNITHNLNKMAEKAGIYYALWRPEELDIKKAEHLIKPLQKGLKKLESRPTYFRQFNPENGWGSYEGLVDFVKAYLTACISYPDAIVEVDR